MRWLLGAGRYLVSTIETAQKAHVLLRLAEAVRVERVDDPDVEPLAADIAQVLARGVEFWLCLLDDVVRRDRIEDTVAYDNRAAELSIVNTEIAATLWALLHGNRGYCQRCIASLPGEPHEVAAKAGGRDTCERHMARAIGLLVATEAEAGSLWAGHNWV